MIDAPRAAVFERCVDAVKNVLGGHISSANQDEGTIEAGFGLINSERLTLAVETIDGATRVTIEARRGAIGEPPRSSSYVDALAEYLARQFKPQRLSG